MKIRMQGNSLRFRLKRPEVDRFNEEGYITEIVQLGQNPSDSLQFTLRQSETPQINVQFNNNITTVFIPGRVAAPWSTTDQVGIEATVAFGNGKELKVLIEKDFACVDGSEEENAGSYPNPAASC